MKVPISSFAAHVSLHRHVGLGKGSPGRGSFVGCADLVEGPSSILVLFELQVQLEAVAADCPEQGGLMNKG